jgi:protein TonB
VSKHYTKAFTNRRAQDARRALARRALVLRQGEAMSHELFEGVTAPPARNARSPYTIAVSIVAHILVIASVVIVPLLASGALPKLPSDDYLSIFAEAVPPPPPPLPAPPPSRSTDTLLPDPGVTAVSYEAPDGVHEEVVDPRPPSIGEIDPDAVGRMNGLLGGTGNAPAPPPPPAPKPPAGPQKVGGQIREPRRVFSVAPIYPGLARQARVQGTVVIQAVIGVDGAVRDTEIINSVPLLDQAALDAVRQWRYAPTLLNGEPVPVIMTVSVRFTLQ